MRMKDRLRRSIAEKRNALSPSEVFEKSSRIKKRIFEMDLFRNVQTILFYVSYDNEVFTHDMIKESMSMRKTVVVPKSIPKDSTLILSKLTDWNDLEVGAYNILEPKQESIKEVPVESIDLILVPGVVFDIHGNRIGHGKGYYDRLLNDTQKVSHIGLAFEIQIVDAVLTEEHDLPVDIIVTEERTITCQTSK